MLNHKAGNYDLNVQMRQSNLVMRAISSTTGATFNNVITPQNIKKESRKKFDTVWAFYEAIKEAITKNTTFSLSVDGKQAELQFFSQKINRAAIISLYDGGQLQIYEGKEEIKQAKCDDEQAKRLKNEVQEYTENKAVLNSLFVKADVIQKSMNQSTQTLNQIKIQTQINDSKLRDSIQSINIQAQIIAKNDKGRIQTAVKITNKVQSEKQLYDDTIKVANELKMDQKQRVQRISAIAKGIIAAVAGIALTSYAVSTAIASKGALAATGTAVGSSLAGVSASTIIIGVSGVVLIVGAGGYLIWKLLKKK